MQGLHLNFWLPCKACSGRSGLFQLSKRRDWMANFSLSGSTHTLGDLTLGSLNSTRTHFGIFDPLCTRFTIVAFTREIEGLIELKIE